MAARAAKRTMRTSPAGKPRSKQRGLAYAVVLAAVVIVGMGAEVTYLGVSRVVQADREAELLFRGQAYRRAIESYHRTNGTYPRALEDLLKDPRLPSKRHIRALYTDPMGNGREWLLLRAPDGGIGGVVSRSSKKPAKTANFPASIESFAGAQSYGEWLFEYRPPAPPTAGGKNPALPTPITFGR